MKRLVLVLAALMVLCSSVAFASEGMEVEAGVKVWHNKWKSEDPADINIDFDPALLIGPAVEVKFPNDLFIEASYLISATDYEGTYYIHKVTSDRKDLDLALGYSFSPSFGVFVGYKSVSMDWEMDLGGGNGSIDLTGPMIGVRGNVPVNEMFGIYASAAYLMTEVESTNPVDTTKEDAPGSVFELGLKAKFSEELSGALGYKVESTKEDKTNTKDTFSGFTLGVMYAF